MRILFDNVNFGSPSGPNSFGKKLSDALLKNGHVVTIENDEPDVEHDVQLSFIAATQKVAPIVQRLDGIYFNKDQDYEFLNKPIIATYNAAESVIFQSEFNKELTTKWFGEKENSYVIHNGTNLSEIESISPMKEDTLDKFEDVWCCASSWRPHKRLSENIRYFLEHSSETTCLVIAGDNPDAMISYDRIFYTGMLDRLSLLSLYKRSSKFLHLAWLDHCPNVVIDARAAGCHIVCSSAGGTCEISGKDSTIMIEDQWDHSPVQLYAPPRIDFSLNIPGEIDSCIDIDDVATRYIEVFSHAIEKEKDESS